MAMTSSLRVLLSEAVENASHLVNKTEEHVELLGESEIGEQEFALIMFMFMMLLIVVFMGAHVLHKFHITILHEAGIGVVVGLIVGIIVRFSQTPQSLDRMVMFKEQFFFLVLLPPIIFESGYNMKRRNFFANLGGICLLAFIGTTVSTFVIAFFMYAVRGVGVPDELELIECLLFGALISATDPVTVLAIFSELKVEPNLFALVFGESVLNDAVALVLYEYVEARGLGAVSVMIVVLVLTEGFRTLEAFVGENGDMKPITGEAIGIAFGSFLLIFVGSFLIGTAVALLASLLFKHTNVRSHAVLEQAIVVLFALASYTLADGLKLSGIVSVLFCGIAMAHYAYNNLSEQSQHVTRDFFRILAHMAETFVFIYIGLGLFSFSQDYSHMMYVLWAVIACLLGRAVHVFPIGWCVNRWRRRSASKGIPMASQVMIFFSGLRGAVAFALSLKVPEILPHNKTILTITLFIVVITVMLMGGATIPVLKKLKIPMNVEDTTPEIDEIDVEFHTLTNEGEEAASQKVIKVGRFITFDRKYLKPFFTKMAPTAPPKAEIEMSGLGKNIGDSENGAESDEHTA